MWENAASATCRFTVHQQDRWIISFLWHKEIIAIPYMLWGKVVWDQSQSPNQGQQSRRSNGKPKGKIWSAPRKFDINYMSSFKDYLLMFGAHSDRKTLAWICLFWHQTAWSGTIQCDMVFLVNFSCIIDSTDSLTVLLYMLYSWTTFKMTLSYETSWSSIFWNLMTQLWQYSSLHLCLNSLMQHGSLHSDEGGTDCAQITKTARPKY